MAMATKSIVDGNWLTAAISIRDRASAAGLSGQCTWQKSEVNCDMYSKENEGEDSNLIDFHLLSLKGCIMQIGYLITTCLA